LKVESCWEATFIFSARWDLEPQRIEDEDENENEIKRGAEEEEDWDGSWKETKGRRGAG
jgi:hypothetical protein